MTKSKAKKNILITGAAGHLGRLVASRLAEKFNVVGVDSKVFPKGEEFPGVYHRIKLSKRGLGDIVSSTKFEGMIHLGRIRTSSKNSRSNRYKENVIGTKSLLSLGLENGIKNFVVIGSHLVYGPVQENPLYITEEFPLRGGILGGDYADAIEMDHQVTNFMWKNREARTVLLRPVHIVGDESDDILVRALSGGVCPFLLGFDPLVQFIDELDMVKAIEASLAGSFYGVYNVVGEGVIPISKAIEASGAVAVPVPPFMSRLVRGVVGKFGFVMPDGWTKFIKYPTVVDGSSFEKAAGFKAEVSVVQSLNKLK